MEKTSENEDELVFTTYITLKNGQRLYAKQRGKKFFAFQSSKRKITRNNIS